MHQYGICQEVNIDVLNPFITIPTKNGHTHSDKSSAKAGKLSECV